MLYTDLTKKAIKISYDAHHGQSDKGGMPYVFHPYHLAEQMNDELSVCVALLHDVVEDTDITIEQLEKDFPKEVIDAVRLLTREPSMDYFEYIKAIKYNDIAKKVKLADIEHNSDETRVLCEGEAPSEHVKARRKKYDRARLILMDETIFKKKICFSK